MKKLIQASSWLCILSTSIVLVFSGVKGHDLEISNTSFELAVNIMYSFFVLASLLVIYAEFKSGDKMWIFIFGLPVDILILSMILPLFNIHFHPSTLFLFDTYIIIAFSFYLGNTYCSKKEPLVHEEGYE